VRASRSEQGDAARAANELAAALSLGPRAETWFVLGDLIARQGDYPGGLEAYLKHLAPHEAYQRLGEQALRLGDYRALCGTSNARQRPHRVGSSAHTKVWWWRASAGWSSSDARRTHPVNSFDQRGLPYGNYECYAT
jgi:tetratricopeptide (TPR) repeat protein